MDINNKLKHSIYEKYKEIVISLTNPISRSEFQNSGKLTPNEFIDAGDMLIQKFPAWEWCSGKLDITPSLPQNKKYLKLSCVPSKTRSISDEIVSLEKDGWEITEFQNIKSHQNNENENENENESKNKSISDSDSDNDFIVNIEKNNNMRLYNLSVIYDPYYATPRLYLIGYDSQSNPLTGDLMMEDVFATNREKTVTIEMHPFLKIPCMSIHPCRHAETMKRILQQMEEKIIYEQELLNIPKIKQIQFFFPASMSLFIFLKFMSSVIPTIEYDVSLGIEF
jgi:ubiquitin-like-conjugating enzyme ATG3